jgi:hypothetical protein
MSFKKGITVRVIAAVDHKHDGKTGLIIDSEDWGDKSLRIKTPIIKLTDGTLLRGYECWWTEISS